MADLQVDLDGLRSLSGTLGRIRSDLDATRRVVDSVREDVGDDGVYDALGDFENHWDDGRGQINQNMQAMQEILEESVKAFEQTDQDLTDSLNESKRTTTTTTRTTAR